MLIKTISDLDVKVSKLDEDCEKKTAKLEELRKEEQQIKKLLTNHQNDIRLHFSRRSLGYEYGPGEGKKAGGTP